MSDTINKADQQIEDIIKSDRESVENFLAGKSTVFDAAKFKRVFLSEISNLINLSDRNKILGFSKRQIREMVENPARFKKSLIRLSNYMMLKSGFYQQLIHYYADMARCNWTVDLELGNYKVSKQGKANIQKNYVKCLNEVNKYRLEQNINSIFERVFVEDVCFGYLLNSGNDYSIFFFDADQCEISIIADGVYGYNILINRFTKTEFDELPEEIRNIVIRGKEQNIRKYPVPIEKSFCIKYNDRYTFLYPPFFNLIGNILSIDDFRLLARTKTESEAYRLLVMRIPLTTENQVALDSQVIEDFFSMARNILPDQIGALPSPMEVSPVQFKSDQAERNKVSDAKDDFYDEAGVASSLFSGATTASELKQAIEADAGEVYRIYRKIEQIINLHLKMKGYSAYSDYTFRFQILNITSFNTQDYIDRELTLAQASIPNKIKLCAAAGISPIRLLGNQYLENDIFEIGKNWTVLSTSFTQSSSSEDDVGRPELDDDEKSNTTQVVEDNDGNDPDNHV